MTVTTPDTVRPMSDRWRQLAVQLAPDAIEWELDYLGQVCTRLDLSPFTNPAQIVLIGRYDSRVGRVVHRPQVTVDGRLALAVRTGRVAGLEGPHFTGLRTEWTDLHGQRVWVDMWDCKDEGAYPRAARYLIHVNGYVLPVNGTAPWLEFCQRDSKGKLLPLWARMPTTMLAKTALSLGLRRSGIENLPADVPVDYEGDSPVLAVPPGETPAPADQLPVPGRGGPNEHQLADAKTAQDPYTCVCGEIFPTMAAFHAHRHAADPPEQVYDDSPESRGYDDDVQPASYEDPGRPFEPES
jgi:hypothetical protein